MPKRPGFLLILCLLVILTISTVASPVAVWSPQLIEWNRIIQELTDTEFTPKTGIDVQIYTIPWSGFEQTYLLSAASGNVPEIGITSLLSSADLGVRGVAVDLSLYGNDYQEIKDQMYPGCVRAFEYKDNNFGLPMQMLLYPLLYRSDVIQKLGIDVPKTWDELYIILPKLQASNRNFYTAFGFDEGQGDFLYVDASMFIWQNGGDWYNEELTASGLDSKESIAGFKAFTELFTRRQIPKTAESFVGFREGDLPLMLSSMWQYATIKTAMPELEGKWNLALVPGTKTSDGTINHASYVGGMSFTLFKDADRVDDAFVWLKWFLSPEIQGKMAQRVANEVPGTIFLPANLKALNEIPIPKEHVSVVLSQARSAKAPAYALLPESAAQRLINFAAYETVIEGKNAEESIRKAAKKMTLDLQQKQKDYVRFIEKL